MNDNQQKRYKCPECGLHYTEKEIAVKCESWCREHKSCNLDITKSSIEAKQRNESTKIDA